MTTKAISTYTPTNASPARGAMRTGLRTPSLCAGAFVLALALPRVRVANAECPGHDRTDTDSRDAEPAPTPTPSVDDTPEPADARAPVRVDARAPVRVERRAARRYLPSLSAALGSSTESGLFGHFWLGGTIERGRGAGFYVGAGVDLDIRGEPDADAVAKAAGGDGGGTRLEIWPVFRAGVSYYAKRERIPTARAYWLLGIMPDLSARYQLRFGAGVSVPPLLPLLELGVPSMVEVTVDAGEAGMRASIRAGWNI